MRKTIVCMIMCWVLLLPGIACSSQTKGARTCGMDIGAIRQAATDSEVTEFLKQHRQALETPEGAAELWCTIAELDLRRQEKWLSALAWGRVKYKVAFTPEAAALLSKLIKGFSRELGAGPIPWGSPPQTDRDRRMLAYCPVYIFSLAIACENSAALPAHFDAVDAEVGKVLAISIEHRLPPAGLPIGTGIALSSAIYLARRGHPTSPAVYQRLSERYGGHWYYDGLSYLYDAVLRDIKDGKVKPDTNISPPDYD